MTTRRPDRRRVLAPSLHAGQQQVERSRARFRVLACGRRWGKTRLGVVLCTKTAVSGGRAWWVAPTYPVATVGWRALKSLARQIPGVDIREGDRLVTLPTGGWVQVRSADNPDSLRGEGLDFLVVDECAFVREQAWTEALRPALSDRQGQALFISTPKGRNWFWRMWVAGQEGGEYQSWRFPTASNPFIVPSEIAAAQQMLPERIFAQEYLAEFLEDGGGVFRKVLQAATGQPQAPEAGHEYVVGCDWGKLNDFTCLSVIDITAQPKRQVWLDRFNQIDYVVQMARLRALCERYRPIRVRAERNAMGEPLIEMAYREGLPVEPFITTNATKAAIIDGLAMAFEREDLVILNDPVQTAELEAYEMERLPSGVLRYNAPEGLHDDTVMALALAWGEASQPPAFDIGIDPAPGFTPRYQLRGRR